MSALPGAGGELSDLDIVRACARAMRYNEYVNPDPRAPLPVPPELLVLCMDEHATRVLYNPLHDKAQAFDLVEKFNLRIDRTRGIPERWGVFSSRNFSDMTIDADLKHAICLCVARLEGAKEKA